LSLLTKIIAKPSDTTRWYVAIPILTNSVLLFDFIKAAVALFPAAACFVLLVQFVSGGHVEPAHVEVALRTGAYVSASLFAAFCVVGLIVLRNRYAAFYEIRDNVLVSEVMRCTAPTGLSDLFRTRPWAIEAPDAVQRSRRRSIRLDRLQSIRRIPRMRLFLLSEQGGRSFMKVYCPDEVVFGRFASLLEEASRALSKPPQQIA